MKVFKMLAPWIFVISGISLLGVPTCIDKLGWIGGGLTALVLVSLCYISYQLDRYMEK